MKFKALFLSLLLSSGIACFTNAQTQINNSGFEDWENVGSATEEPLEWNSFKTASGILSNLASQQIKRSPLTRPGTSGTYSCVIWSKEIMSIVANGNFTTGQINMSSATPSDPSNYNITYTAQTPFSEALGANPDSLVVWVRFKPSNSGGTDSARIRAIIHDTYDLKDPIDASSAPHVVGIATKHVASTNGQWERLSIPFEYTGPASSPDFIQITFTTNKTPGGGSGGDSLYVDDLSLIYNPNGIENENANEEINIYTRNNNLVICRPANYSAEAKVIIYNISGQAIYTSQLNQLSKESYINLSVFKAGIYIANVVSENGQSFSQKFSVQ